MNSKKLLMIGCCAAFLSGCSSMISEQQPAQADDPAAIKLAEAATSVSQSLGDMEAIQKASTPVTFRKTLPDPAIDGMMGYVSIDWSGPIEPLLQKVAAASSYQVRVLGARPAVPVLVSINAQNTPLSYVLRDADFQCGSKANIVVYPKLRVIELRYMQA